MEIIHKSAWVQVENRKMLFLRSKGKDIFYLPGGKREDGETNEEALIREIKEEAGVDLLSETVVKAMQFTLPAHGRHNTEVDINAYLAEYIGTIAPTSEIEEVGWFDSREDVSVPSAGKVILKWLKEQDLVD